MWFFFLQFRPRPYPHEWYKMDTSPVYKNGNVLREYQLEGVNWLTFCWCNRWKVLPLCYYTIIFVLMVCFIARVVSYMKTADILRCHHWFHPKCCLRMERRNSILMTYHFPDLGSTSDWLCHIRSLLKPVRIATQFWIVTRHHYGISVLIL